jgi:RNA processing factor Prp31
MSLTPRSNNPSELNQTAPTSPSLTKSSDGTSGLSAVICGVTSLLHLDVVARLFKQAFDGWYGFVIDEELSQVVTEVGEYVVCIDEAFDETAIGNSSFSSIGAVESTLVETDEGETCLTPS